ncbi:MAG: HEAT repeat domain-containing protein [Planctomycetes bacterium]|nr:HEAT repeat domain-containing protein [Planctomycetota bacterium]MCB9919261.1 HEAT repeat domain-containing protein [Planctomycetota bacterium]
MCALAALTLAGWQFFERDTDLSNVGNATAMADEGTSDRIHALESAVSRLEQVPTRDLRATGSPNDGAPARLASTEARFAKLDERIAALEASVARLTTARIHAPTTGSSTAGMPSTQRPARDDAAEASKHQITAADANADVEQRMRALRHLRGIEGGRSPSVVAAMIHLAQTSQDPEVRADVWRQMSRAKDKQLVAPMMQAVQSDAHPKVREEAAETLGDFLDEPGVRSILQHVSENDVEEDVRRQARSSLERRR